MLYINVINICKGCESSGSSKNQFIRSVGKSLLGLSGLESTFLILSINKTRCISYVESFPSQGFTSSILRKMQLGGLSPKLLFLLSGINLEGNLVTKTCSSKNEALLKRFEEISAEVNETGVYGPVELTGEQLIIINKTKTLQGQNDKRGGMLGINYNKRLAIRNKKISVLVKLQKKLLNKIRDNCPVYKQNPNTPVVVTLRLSDQYMTTKELQPLSKLISGLISRKVTPRLREGFEINNPLQNWISGWLDLCYYLGRMPNKEENDRYIQIVGRRPSSFKEGYSKDILDNPILDGKSMRSLCTAFPIFYIPGAEGSGNKITKKINNVCSRVGDRSMIMVEPRDTVVDKFLKVISARSQADHKVQRELTQLIAEVPEFATLAKIYKQDTAAVRPKYFNKDLVGDNAVFVPRWTLPLVARSTRVQHQKQYFSDLGVVQSSPRVQQFLFFKGKKTDTATLGCADGIERKEYEFKGGSKLYKDEPRLIDYLKSETEHRRFSQNRMKLQFGASPRTQYHNELEARTLVGQIYLYNNINKSLLSGSQHKYVNDLRSSIHSKLSALPVEKLDTFLRSKVRASQPNSLANFSANHAGHMAPPMMTSRIIKFGDYHAMSPLEREQNPLPEESKGRRVPDFSFISKDTRFYEKKFGYQMTEYSTDQHNLNVIWMKNIHKMYDPKSYSADQKLNFIQEVSRPVDSGVTGHSKCFVAKSGLFEKAIDEYVASNIKTAERRYEKKHGFGFSQDQIMRMYSSGNYHSREVGSSFERMNEFSWDDSPLGIFSPDRWVSHFREQSFYHRYNEYKRH
jgi:hypothetical protein